MSEIFTLFAQLQGCFYIHNQIVEDFKNRLCVWRPWFINFSKKYGWCLKPIWAHDHPHFGSVKWTLLKKHLCNGHMLRNVHYTSTMWHSFQKILILVLEPSTSSLVPNSKTRSHYKTPSISISSNQKPKPTYDSNRHAKPSTHPQHHGWVSI